MAEEVKTVFVLDMFHIVETMIGHERLSNLTVEEALRLVRDTKCLVEGKMGPSEYKRIWNLK
jgi:hypothetical protein